MCGRAFRAPVIVDALARNRQTRRLDGASPAAYEGGMRDA